MARIYHKPQYLLGRALPGRALHRLMFEPGVKTAYLSYPMQHAEGDRAALAAFKARLDSLVLVFDPADVNDFEIETPGQSSTRPDATALGGTDSAARSDGTAELRQAVAQLSVPDKASAASPFTERDLRHIADQIVFRDYKLIAQSDMVVVFYDALVPSPGVISEMNYALQTGKRVYGVWLPSSEPSPFFTRYCTRVFRSEDDLFGFFAQHGVAGNGAPQGLS
jgi:adenylate kinase